MNPSIIVSRRIALASAFGSAVLLSMRQAVAQTSTSGGDWLAMVKAHHQLISKTFDTMLASTDTTFLRRTRLERTLAYQLTAHSVAEENVLYPSLAMNGLVSESDKLYLDQAHAKVMNAELEFTDVKDAASWTDKVRALQAAVLKHATDDEEGDLYPRLQQKLDARMSSLLSAAYRREFSSVKPRRESVDQ